MSKNNLDDIVSRYKKELVNKYDVTPELEIRFRNVDFHNFTTIYNYLLETTDVSKAYVSQLVSSLMKQKGSNQGQTTNIREIHFKNGKSIKKLYNSKTSVLIPYYDTNQSGLSYIVSLSLEKSNIKEFISDESAIIRIKNRISFFITEDNIEWRVDMSVVRQILGSNIAGIDKIINQMFKSHNVTVDNILSIFSEDKTSQKIYKYEIEIELMNNDQIKSNDILNIAKKLLFIANPEYVSENTLQSKIYDIAKYIVKSPGLLQQFQSKLGLKQLLPKVQALTRYDYRNIYPLQNYFITDKADGIRAIGMCEGMKGYIVSDSLQTYDMTNKLAGNVNVTIVDAELIDDMLYIFDVIVVDGTDVSQLGFEQRITLLDKAANELQKMNIKAEAKPYTNVQDMDLEKYIKEMYNRKRPYDIDGLIFVKLSDTYLLTKSYKWKRIEDNTIDFLVKKAPKTVLGQKPYMLRDKYTIYFLFVGISNDMFQALGLHRCLGYNDIFDDAKLTSSSNYFPIQFSPSNSPLAYIYYHPDSSILDIENNVVEFRCIRNCSSMEKGPLVEWQPVRIRKDRQKDLESKTYYGNDYKVAEITWINYMDPFPLDHLWLNVTDDYFASNKAGIYHAQTSVLSFLKNERIMSFSHYNWIIDIGSGKGQDLGRYFSAKIKNLIAIDNDKSSLSELIRRKFTFAQNKTKHISTNVYVILADMTNDYTMLLDKIYDVIPIPLGHIDAIICNLSIHYYIYTNELLNNYINFVSGLVKTNGHLVITCFFGEAIFKLLENIDEGQSWTVYENEVIKYSIKKMYSSKKLENMGQKIGVILPFSNGEYYEEYLVNTGYLVKELKKHGFTLLNKLSVFDIIDDFTLKNPSVASSLTQDDIKYLSLYGELVFQKNK